MLWNALFLLGQEQNYWHSRRETKHLLAYCVGSDKSLTMCTNVYIGDLQEGQLHSAARCGVLRAVIICSHWVSA